MAAKGTNKYYQRLKRRYRFVIMRDDTFEEKMRLRLTGMNIFITFITVTVSLIIATTFIIAFTPLREYIPGYSDVTLDRKVWDLSHRTDSLSEDFNQKQLYLDNLQRILKGEEVDTKIPPKPPETNKDPDIDFHISEQEKKLRNEIEQEERFSINPPTDREVVSNASLYDYFFFLPVNGIVSAEFNPSKKHYGVDIVAKNNDIIKATMDGTVIFSEWTLETGNVVGIQHRGNIISVYKHNSTLLKKEGDYVRAGDVIAIVGNSGELSSGPHLHFELWHNGNPVNPVDYIRIKD